MERHAVIAGATGLVGGELVKLLLGLREYSRVTVLVRRRINMTHPRLEQRVIDFEALGELPQELLAGADLYCALGTTRRKAGSKEAFRRVDYHYPMELARQAKRSGAARLLVISSIGADAGSLFFYTRVKGEVERDLRSLGLPALYLFRPSLILGDRGERRFGEGLGASLAKAAPWLFAGRLAAYKPVEAAVIARAMAAAALRKEPGQEVIASHEMPQLAALVPRSR